ncbi:DUF2909 domain-containing protein [Porticoccaceae bacterium]|nr:DUF2909 domain-containing protein [Porticoccaceae bacterium]MDA8788487.1 DUF2909 domain-containing protein [Porticoccaceae bacterium]MDB2635273.1 DUF2909 domain-containing protein [Porticoccaceae bacterium]
MLFKAIIVILFIGMLISLFTALRYLVKDLGSSKRRVMNTLRIRVTIAVLLIATVVIGAFTGQIGNQAPWDKKLKANVTGPELNQPQDSK